MYKRRFVEIGGYDEDFIGWAYDDCDLVERLKRHNCKFVQTDSVIIHLYHPKRRIGIKENSKMYLYNKNLYLRKNRKGIIFSNENREWGVLGEKITKRDVEKPTIKNKEKEVKEEIKSTLKVKEPPKTRITVRSNVSDNWHLTKIPKIAHFYWGNEKLPYLRYLTIYSFHKYNPDWEIRIYVPNKKYAGRYMDCIKQSFRFSGQDYYPNLRKLPVKIIEIDFDFIGIDKLATDELAKRYLSRQEVYRSDFLRWHLLSTEGGLWSDMDIIYFKSMTKLEINKESNKETNTVISLHPKYKHSVGFMLSGINNPYFKSIFQFAKNNFNPKAYQSIGVDLLNVKFPNVEAIERQFPSLKGTTKDMPIKSIYAYDGTCIASIYKSSNMSRYNDNSIGLHWYAGYTLAEKYINEVTHLNYDKYRNVLAQTIKKVYNNKVKK